MFYQDENAMETIPSDKNPIFLPNTAACIHCENANVLTIGKTKGNHKLTYNLNNPITDEKRMVKKPFSQLLGGIK